MSKWKENSWNTYSFPLPSASKQTNKRKRLLKALNHSKGLFFILKLTNSAAPIHSGGMTRTLCPWSLCLIVQGWCQFPVIRMTILSGSTEEIQLPPVEPLRSVLSWLLIWLKAVIVQKWCAGAINDLFSYRIRLNPERDNWSTSSNMLRSVAPRFFFSSK